MDDLLRQLTETNGRRQGEALKYRREFRKQDAMKTRTSDEGVMRRAAFRSQVSTVGGEFHPVLRLKPKVLDVWTAERCVMPSRSYTVGKVPVRMHHTPEFFPSATADKATVGKAFLEFLEDHEKQRLRHVYPILFSSTEVRAPDQSEVSLDPFRNAVSKVSRDIQLVYPYQALEEKKILMRGKPNISHST